MPMAKGRKQSIAMGLTEQSLKRLAARILEQQCTAARVRLKRQGTRRPRAVQRVLQTVFVGQAIETTWSWDAPKRASRPERHLVRRVPPYARFCRRRARPPPTRPGDGHLALHHDERILAIGCLARLFVNIGRPNGCAHPWP